MPTPMKTSKRPGSFPKSHANSDSSVPIIHSHASGASQKPSAAPHSIFPQRHSVDSGQSLLRPMGSQHSETPSSTTSLSLNNGPSFSSAEFSSSLVNTLENSHYSPASPFSDVSCQESSVMSMDEIWQPCGPLLPVDDSDLSLRHRPTLQDKSKQTRGIPYTAQAESSPMLKHIHAGDVTRHPIYASRLRHNSNSSYVEQGGAFQHLVQPHALQHQLGMVESDPSGALSMPNGSRYLLPGALDPRETSEYQADSDSNASDDDSTVINSRSRRRLSSAAGTQASQINVPSPNDQAEERQMEETNGIVVDWMKCVSPDNVIENGERNLDSGDVSPTQEHAGAMPNSGVPFETSNTAINGYGQITREFDKISLAPTWGSARRRSFDSLTSSEIGTVNVANITTKPPTRPWNLLQRIRSQGNGRYVPKPKPDPIPQIINTPGTIKDEHSPRSFSEDYSFRGSSPLSTSEQQPPGANRSRLGSFLKRSRSRGSIDQSKAGGLKDLLQQSGGPPAPMINPHATTFDTHLSSVQPSQLSNNQLLHPNSVDMMVDIKTDGSASPSSSDVSHSTLPIPTEATADAFRSHACQICPNIHNQLLEKVVDQQVRNYHRLVLLRHNAKMRPQEGNAQLDDNKPQDAARRRSLNPPKGTTQWRIVRDGMTSDGLGTTLHESDRATMPVAVFPRGVPIPPIHRLPAVFECPWCFKLLNNIKNPSDWTKHILEDIQPYICTFADCTSSSLFKRKADWLRHETEKHRRQEKWTCSECQRVCYRKDNFAQHLGREHPNQDPSQQNAKQDPRVEQCRETNEKAARDEPCRFCGRTFNDWKPLTKHLAEHMEQISLPTFILVEQSKDLLHIPYVSIEGVVTSEVEEDSRHSDDTSSIGAKEEEEDAFDEISLQRAGLGIECTQMQGQTYHQTFTNIPEYAPELMNLNNSGMANMDINNTYSQYLNLDLMHTESAPAAFGSSTAEIDPAQTPPTAYGESLSLSTSPENISKHQHSNSTGYNSTFPPPSGSAHANNIVLQNNGQQSTYNTTGFQDFTQDPSNLPNGMGFYSLHAQQSEEPYTQQLYMVQAQALNTGQLQPVDTSGPQMIRPALQFGAQSFSYPPLTMNIPQQTSQYGQLSLNSYLTEQSQNQCANQLPLNQYANQLSSNHYMNQQTSNQYTNQQLPNQYLKQQLPNQYPNRQFPHQHPHQQPPKLFSNQYTNQYRDPRIQQ